MAVAGAGGAGAGAEAGDATLEVLVALEGFFPLPPAFAGAGPRAGAGVEAVAGVVEGTTEETQSHGLPTQSSPLLKCVPNEKQFAPPPMTTTPADVTHTSWFTSIQLREQPDGSW